MPQLSSSQRYKIEALNCLKYGVSEISEKTGIPKSTVSRELSRNSKNGRYEASRAEKMSRERRKRGAYKMKGELLGEVDKMLNKQNSPEQISGRLELENSPKVSPETIYQYVYRDKKSRSVGTLRLFIDDKSSYRTTVTFVLFRWLPA
jgi:transposase, IS30 family